MKRTAAVTAAALLLAAAARAGEPGTASFQLLRVAESARQAAMGQAGVAVTGEASNAHLNPAALALLSAQELSTSYSQFFDDIGLGSVGYARRAKGWGVGGQFHHLDYGDVDRADASGARGGSARGGGTALILTGAREGRYVSPGASLKLVQEKLDGFSALVPAIDAGVLFRLPAPSRAAGPLRRPWENVTLGFALRNIGPNAGFETATEKLPRAVSAGLTHQSFADALTVSADVENAVDRDTPALLRAGVELWVHEVLALRAGYQTSGGEASALSGGVGFRFRSATVDYAFRPVGDLGDRHFITLGFRFGAGEKTRFYEEGLAALRAGRHAEAVLLFNKALLLDPKDQRVLRKAMEAADGLRRAYPPAEPATAH